MQPYEHTQHASWMIVLAIAIAVAALGATSGIGVAWDARLPVLVMFVVIVALVAACSRMVVRVGDAAVSWRLGFLGGSIAIATVASADVVRTNLLEGWGLHYTIWHGWLWNVGGFSAVEIRTRSGGRTTLGTDDPDGLRAAIAARIR